MKPTGPLPTYDTEFLGKPASPQEAPSGTGFLKLLTQVRAGAAVVEEASAVVVGASSVVVVTAGSEAAVVETACV